MELVTQPFFEAIDLSISEDTLNQYCQTFGLPELDDIVGNTEMLICHPDSMRSLRKAMRHVSLILRRDPSQINTIVMQQEIELELPRLLLNALSSAKPQQENANPAKRYRALTKAVDYIRAFSNTSLTLNDLCQATGVSGRTLQHAFVDQYDLTPKAYLRTHRLNNVHKVLSSAQPAEIKIADIAHRRGFNHMGQFSTDYHQLFGELPSATLDQPPT